MTYLHLLCIYILLIPSIMPLHLPHSMPLSASSTSTLSSTSHLATLGRRLRCDVRLGSFCTLILYIMHFIKRTTEYFEAAGAARHSCVNAMGKISPWNKPVIFGSRSVEVKDVIVPLRYLSDDGLCAIDVTLVRGTSGDVANGIGLLHAARTVWDKCAIGSASGGVINGFCR